MSLANGRLPILMLLIILSLSAAAQKEEVCYNPNLVTDTTKKSIKSIAVGTIGGGSMTIRYHSPGVRKRVLWGGLVPYGEVWVTGAHDATILETSKPFFVSGKLIPAGKYALFTIPGKKEWTVIVNSHWQQHLASEYDAKDDIVRVQVKPKKIKHIERLQYFVEEGKNDTGHIAIAWEQIRVELPVRTAN